MNYPIGFPIKFRADADVALARDRKNFFEKANQLPEPRNFSVREALEQLMNKRVKTSVAEFGKLACKAVKEGLWPPYQAGPAMEEFLQTIARAAYNDANDLYDDPFYYSFPDLEKAITTSDEWLGCLEEFAKGPEVKPSTSAEKAPKNDGDEPVEINESILCPRASDGVPDTDRPLADMSSARVDLQSAYSPPTQPRRGGNRTPDVETSRERVALYSQLASELSRVLQWRKKNRKLLSLSGLKAAFPDFRLWERLPKSQYSELLKDDIDPKAFAWNIVRVIDGLNGESNSRSVLKKDRAKIRKADLSE